MTRDIAESAKAIMHGNDKYLQSVAEHDPDMLREVADALLRRITPKPKRWHNEDCELRGDGPCYCDQSLGKDYP